MARPRIRGFPGWLRASRKATYDRWHRGPVNGARWESTRGVAWFAVPVLGVGGVVTLVTLGTAAQSPILLDPLGPPAWREAMAAACWPVGTYKWWRRPKSRSAAVG